MDGERHSDRQLSLSCSNQLAHAAILVHHVGIQTRWFNPMHDSSLESFCGSRRRDACSGYSSCSFPGQQRSLHSALRWGAVGQSRHHPSGCCCAWSSAFGCRPWLPLTPLCCYVGLRPSFNVTSFCGRFPCWACAVLPFLCLCVNLGRATFLTVLPFSVKSFERNS